MKNLQTIKLILITCCSFITLLSNAIDLDAQKEVLKRIWICQTIMNGDQYITPAEYTVDSTSNNLTGQLYYNFNETKYTQLSVDFSNPNSISSSIKRWLGDKHNKIELRLENDELVSMKEESRSKVYKIRKEANGNYTVNEEYTVSGNLKSNMIKVTMDGDKIVKIEEYIAVNNKVFLYSTSTYTYSDKQVIFNRLYHVNGQGKTKPRLKPEKFLYRIKSENNVYKENNYRSNEYVYNSEGNAIEEISVDAEELNHSYFEYINGNLAKTTTFVTVNNIKKKEIVIPEDLPNADTNKPEYEWRNGNYIFDGNDNLIFESRDLKYRKKINGVWSEWQFMRM